jgi:hypothetical protein
MIDLTPSGAASTSDVPSPKSTSLHSRIEQAIRHEMRCIRALASPTPSRLRADLRSICADAHRLDMRAELLVIAVKKVWQEIPEARSFARPREMDSLLSDVVTMTLDEFYRASTVVHARGD